MNSANTKIIFGPPGTGKTTRLLGIVEDLMAGGMDPARIAFIAFTRKAAKEARERAIAKFNLTAEELPLFRTLHSLAFKQLTLTRTEVMGMRDYFEIAKELGLYLTAKGLQEDGTLVGLSKGDRLLFMESMARARMLDLRDYWSEYPDEDINFWELERLDRSLREYKESVNKIDFIDILYRFIGSGEVPPHDVLIIDEAQDLSPLQWQVVKKLGKNSRDIYIAGDDDQAIFTWAGADVSELLHMPGEREILHQSYRVPGEIQQVAHAISSRIKDRVKKEWSHRKAIGTVEYVASIEQVDMSKGTWLLLARNMYLLDQYTQHCLRVGYVFDGVNSPVRGDALRAIVAWEALRKGESVTAARCKIIYDYMGTKVGVAYGSKKKLDERNDNESLFLYDLHNDYGLLTNAIWHEALDKITVTEREYFIAALRRGEKLLKDPRIRISTIHSVKGGEADNVVVCLDMAMRSFQEFHKDPDSEHRVWYVAVTRARENLYILQPQSGYHYAI